MTASSRTSPYCFDNSSAEAATQLRLIAEILDQHTRSVLGGLGIGPDWRCLEVGAGSGTVACWLADQAGPAGSVSVVDIDPALVRRHDRVETHAADIRTFPLPPNHFDLVYARLVLTHIPTRQDVLHRLADALAPGGALVITEWDTHDVDGMLVCASTKEEAAAFEAFQRALAGIHRRGADCSWAHRVPRVMREAGLIDLEAVIDGRLWAGGEAGCLLHASNSRQKAELLRSAGMTEAQLVAFRSAMSNPGTLIHYYPTVTTIGRRPIV